jgi:TolB-like protein/DNA-binding winged helix-turn-helix (wHTH) protein/tetratricopeptide (TPR) repeat protein
MEPPAQPRAYRFGAFELDVRSGELRRKGLKVRLRGRPIDILLFLIARQGELVSRDELRTQLWKADTFVDFDHGLNSAMNKLREALGDTGGDSRYIDTVPRRGYRFIAPVEVLHDPPVPAPAADLPPPVPVAIVDEPSATVEPPAVVGAARHPAQRRRHAIAWVAAAAVLVAAVATLASILAWTRQQPASTAGHRVMLVVLPFENVDGTAEQDFFTDGITDEMITQIGTLNPQQVGVIARTTAMQYKRSKKGVMEIGRELNVDYVLEGSVRRGSARVRITAQLIDVKSQTQLWTQAYERDLEDVLMLQRDVAMRLAESLKAGVLSSALAGPPQQASPKFAAYELVLRARYLRQQATEESAWRCVAMFDEAIRIDPGYAPAHAGLADCYRLLGAPGWEAGPPKELLEQARRAADRALALDPNLAEGYAARAMVRFNSDWDLEAASQDLSHAMALSPSLARAWQYKSAILTAMGRFDEAVQAARQGQELDPLSVLENTTLGVRLYYARRFPEAITQFNRTLATNPGFGVAHWGLAETYRELGRHAESIPELRKAAELSNNAPYMRAWLVHGLAAAGQRDEANAIRRDLERLSNERYLSPFLFALMASGFGERDQTISWLEKTLAVRSGWMPFVPVEPEFQWLRTDPAFDRLIARVRPPST